MSATRPSSFWEDFFLRVIAIYKLVHGFFFIAVGVGLIKLKYQNIPQVLQDYILKPFHWGPENRFVDWALDAASKLNPHLIVLISDAAFFYAVLFIIEGIGLYMRKPWAEYFVIIVTGSLLPVEIYAICHKLEWWKMVALVGNLLILGYLVHRVRWDARNKGTDEPPGGPSPS